MPKAIVIDGKQILLPPGLIVGDLSKPRVADVFTFVDRNLYCEGVRLLMGYITLSDGDLLKIYTRKTKKAIFWQVVRHQRPVAGGMFRIHPKFYRADVAAAIPAIRDKGLYARVLRYLRATYKTPLVSDTRITIGTLKSWIRAGADVSWRQSALMINPRNAALWCLASLETVSC